jgi:LuxR family maltose regulon positive regulatory protein
LNLFTKLLDVVEACLRLATGDRGCAVDLLDETGVMVGTEARVVSLRTALAGRDRATARDLIAGWWPEGTELRDILPRGIWASVVEYLDGDRRSAVARLGALLPVFEREGHVRILVDSLPFSANLLRELNRVEQSELLERVLAAKVTSISVDPDSGPTESLSERELGIIRYLPTRLSTVEIAAQLYISRNTLKTHLRSIYRKLGVSGRDEAVRRADELGLA